MTKGRAIKRRDAKPGTAAPYASLPRPGLAAASAQIDDETRKQLEDAIGTKNLPFNVNLFARTAKTAYVFQGDGIDAAAEDRFNQTATLAAFKAFKPTDAIEGMMAAQAVMLHNLALEAGRRAMIPDQPTDIACKLRKDAANSARAMTDMVDALGRHRGKGPQVIRVEKMMVTDGGQAVVGNVTSGATLPTSGQAPLMVDARARRELATGEGEQ